MAQDDKLSLQWRGRQAGPWTYEQVQAALQAGEIHSMYQIREGGRQWMTLRDFVERREAADLERRAAALAASIQQQRENEKKLPAPDFLQGTRGGAHPLQQRVERPSPFASPPPVFIKGVSQPQDPVTDFEDTTDTCWLAVAAFVVSCCDFVPYLNLVSWLPSLVLGHLALGQIRRSPDMDGRGLAVAALVISYSMLGLALLTRTFFPAFFARFFILP